MDDIVIVSKKRGDGWYKGTLQRTGRTGLFPASFVQSRPRRPLTEAEATPATAKTLTPVAAMTLGTWHR
ncbi:variant SH3 domain-containing protein [Phthorimaea operculella]|nr:variant SH3 domain-containing protein [Phthorimaea operculella]